MAVVETDYLDVIRAEANRLIAIARMGPLDARVPACPDWDLATLCGHVSRVHRWATVAAATGKQPEGGFGPKPPGGSAAIDYLAEGIEPLVAALAPLTTDQAGWTFTGTNRGGSFWPRRQAQETMVHRWDAESAVGTPTPFEPRLAADGLFEVFRVLTPFRVTSRTALPVFPGDIHLHATDVHSEWVIDAPGGSFSISDAHRKCAVAVRGTASDLLLFMWRRVGPDHPGIEIIGDEAAAFALHESRLLG